MRTWKILAFTFSSIPQIRNGPKKKKIISSSQSRDLLKIIPNAQQAPNSQKKNFYFIDLENEIRTQLLVPGCVPITKEYANERMKTYSFLESVKVKVDEKEHLVIRCKYCAPLWDRPNNLKQQQIGLVMPQNKRSKRGEERFLSMSKEILIKLRFREQEWSLFLQKGNSHLRRLGRYLVF